MNPLSEASPLAVLGARMPAFLVANGVALAVLLSGCGDNATVNQEGPAATPPAPPAAAVPSEAEDAAVVRTLVAAEETGLVLDRKMRVISRGVMDLRLPGPTAEAEAVFAASVRVIDLAPVPPEGGTETTSIEPQSWPLASESESSDAVALWQPLLDRVAFFEHANLELIDGQHPDGDMWQFRSTGIFEGLARMKTDEWQSFSGTMSIHWERPQLPDGGAGEWQITVWETQSMQWAASAKRLFVESLDRAMVDPVAVAKLRRSQHFEATVQHYREGKTKLPHPYFAPISVNQKEGIAVADVNGDGFDDIYITVRIAKTYC